ncbi:hypothetical protein A2Y85_04700 [candidate division WOR-3 bacterium RBG_13_43_14]|uniref:TldD/PmbA family protein n=1 Tax=candidate division WOR-3 bacterium RBG_13_43_14 TaxID=1802590 RepID=A0A1F4UC18_UNCW3|nr:MAG: hypothetical protein A2Y85_04700 [candidate division WOR-3 bacterium RBG_13_43_14]
MEKILQEAMKKSDQAEVFSSEATTNILNYENGMLKDIESTIEKGISLRIIKNKRLGFAYTRNIHTENDLIANALQSLKGGIDAPFTFPSPGEIKNLNTWDPECENLSNTTIAEECQRVNELFAQKTAGQVNISTGFTYSTLRIMNNRRTDLSVRSSLFFMNISLLYPESYAGLRRLHLSKGFTPVPAELIDELVTIYKSSEKQVYPKSGLLKVLFLPEVFYILGWRLQSATNCVNIYQRQSPLVDKIGLPVFNNQLSVVNDPRNDHRPGARAFDDEGTPCCYLPLIENGVVSNFYNDLDYAEKLKTKSTGTGFRGGVLSGEIFATKPQPQLQHLGVLPGKKSWQEMLASIDRGIIISGALGAHSGNIPNGDYSIGLSPGLYVENGEIVGRVKDAMIAGNIYSTLKNIISIEDHQSATLFGYYPSILCDQISFAVKN